MARTAPVPPVALLNDRDVRVVLVCSEFHRALTDALVAGASARLGAAGLPAANIDVEWVLGSFEIPQAATLLARTGRYAAVIALGAVIRGATAHFDHVSMAVSHGLMRAGLDTGVPCTFGVLTCDTMEQARARAGGEVGNAGGDAADAAVALVNLAGRYPTGPRAAAGRG